MSKFVHKCWLKRSPRLCPELYVGRWLLCSGYGSMSTQCTPSITPDPLPAPRTASCPLSVHDHFKMLWTN